MSFSSPQTPNATLMTRPAYPLVLSDGGRSETPGLFSTNADCTVRALAIATCLPYLSVHQELKHAGRRTGRGFDLTTYMAAHRSFMGVKYRRVTFRRKTTVDDVFDFYPTGTLIIDLEAHVFCIIDGVGYDLWRVAGDEPALGVWLF